MTGLVYFPNYCCTFFPVPFSILFLHLLCIVSSLPVHRAAAMTLRTVLLSLQALLAAAEPDDPQDAVVANQVHMRVWMRLYNNKALQTFQLHYCCCFLQYKQNPEMFKQTARLWSHVYAGAPVSSPEYTRKIDKLCSMGFDKVSIESGQLLVWLKIQTQQGFATLAMCGTVGMCRLFFFNC